MPKKLELTWHKTTKRWRKRITIDGKQHDLWFPFGKSKTDMDGYDKALAAWKAKKASIDAEQAAAGPTVPERVLEKAITFRERLYDFHRLDGDDGKAKLFQFEADSLRKLRNRRNLKHDDVAAAVGRLTKPDDRERWLWFDRSRTVAKHHQWNRAGYATDKTAGHNAGTFIALKQSEVPHNLSPGRWASLQYSVSFFVDWLGHDTPLDNVNGKTLVDFRIHLLEFNGKTRKEGGFGRKTANDRIKDIRQFIRWCWQVEAMENLPRNLDSPDLSISFEDAEIVTFAVDEVKQLVKGANDRMKLYLLLFLNCAMLPSDIADLQHSEVDWEQGRIRRPRSKTRKKRQANDTSNRKVPVVDYKLWKQTFDLLREFRSDDPQRVLLNAQGQPLKRSEIGDDGKIDNTSNIAKNYDRLRRRLKIKKENQKPLKTFRATGSSKLQEHNSHGRFAQYYLGQSPRSIADKHYVVPSTIQFDRAMVWLGKQFGIR